MNPVDTSESCWKVLNLDGHKITEALRFFYISIAVFQFVEGLVQCTAMDAVHIFAVQVV